MTLNLDSNYTCCMWYILMTTMYISHGKVDMELKITWVTAEFVNNGFKFNQQWWIVHKGLLQWWKKWRIEKCLFKTLQRSKSLINNWELYTSCSWLPENPQFTLFDTKGIGES